MRTMLLCLALLALAMPAAARTGAKNSQPQPAPDLDSHDEILLKDDSIITGHILSEDENRIVIETAGLGRLTIDRARIKDIRRAGSMLGVRVDPDRNSIMLMPTPATLPKGDHYFRSFELFFMNYGYGIIDDLNLSLAFLFPLTTEWNFLATGLKWQIMDREEAGLGLALNGSYLMAPDEQSYRTFGGVIGIGDARRSLNLAVDYGVDENDDGGERVFVGGDFQLSRKIKIFAEWASSGLVMEVGDDDDDFNGFINLGFRLFGDSMAFSMGAFRPLINEDGGSFVALPLIMFSAHW